MSTTVAKSLDDLVNEVRLTVNDTVQTYRFPDSTVLSFINTALRELYRYRPDAFIGNFTVGVLSTAPVPTYDETDLGLAPATVLPFDDRLFFGPMVFFVAGRVELSDDEFTDNGRAMNLMTAFRNMLITPGG